MNPQLSPTEDLDATLHQLLLHKSSEPIRLIYIVPNPPESDSGSGSGTGREVNPRLAHKLPNVLNGKIVSDLI